MSCPSTILVEKLKAKDEEAFEELYRSLKGPIKAFCLRYVKNEADAEDMVQKTMLLVWTKIDQFKGQCSLKTWVHTIAKSMCLQYLRRPYTGPKDLASLTDILESQGPKTSHKSIVSRIELKEALASLSQPHRLTFLLHHQMGLDRPTIAKLLNVPEGTVATNSWRGQKALRKALKS